MNTDDVDRYEKLFVQLLGLYEEMSLLSKKNPNDAVNTFKLKFINKQIANCNSFLPEGYRPFDDFQKFDDDDMPQNSDVVFILSQYLECFEKLRSDNVVKTHGWWYWHVEGVEDDDADEYGMVEIQTTRPKRLKE